MKKQPLQNKEIYQIGDKVLKSVRMADDEIDRIAVAPDLFKRIRAAAGSDRAAAGPVSAPPVRPFLQALRWQNAAAVFAGILVFAGAIGLLGIVNYSYSEGNLFTAVQHGLSTWELPQIPYDGSPPVELEVPLPEQKASRSITRKTTRIVKGPRSYKEKEIEMGEFQAITYTGDPNEKDEGGQIVRLELSRASLFAMGFDVPVENESNKVKADLFIGSDGVIRGARVEKGNQ